MKLSGGKERLVLPRTNREAEWDEEKTKGNKDNEEFIPMYLPLKVIRADRPMDSGDLKNSVRQRQSGPWRTLLDERPVFGFK